MASEMQVIIARLQRLADEGVEGGDVVRLRFLQAMARRAQNLDGQARQVVEDRLRNHLDAFEQALRQRQTGKSCQKIDLDDEVLTSTHVSRSQELNEVGNPSSASTHMSFATLLSAMQQAASAYDEARRSVGFASRTAYPELGLLDAAQDTWMRLSTDKQLREAEKRIPDNAGPLNSNHLMHRALALMKDTSPTYLRQYLSYANALAWLAQLADTKSNAQDAMRANRTARSRKR